MLRLTNVTKAYDMPFKLEADFELQKGRLLALLGPSGCGKTTILRLLAGLENPDSGTIAIDGVDVTRIPPRLRSVGLVFQDYALFPHLSVAGNVEYGLKVQKVNGAQRKVSIEDALGLVGLAGKGSRDVSTLSGGERQRVALARCLVTQPKILLLDEPFSALDESVRRSLRKEVKRLQNELGLTTVFVTHSREEALSMADDVIVMRSGQMLQMGSPQEVYRRPRDRYCAEFLGDCNWLTGTIVGIETQAVGRHLRLLLDSGHQVDAIWSSDETPVIGSKVWLMFRWEDVVISGGYFPQSELPQKTGFTFKGEICGVDYLGSTSILTLGSQLGSMSAAISSRLVPQRGTTIECYVPSDSCICFPMVQE